MSEGVQAAAQAIIAATGSTTAATSLQNFGNQLKRPQLSSKASTCRDRPDSSCQAPPNKARRLQVAQGSATSNLHMQQQQLSTGALSRAALSVQQQQHSQQEQQQLQRLQQAADAGAAAPDFEQILYETIHEMLGTAGPVAASDDSGGSSSSSLAAPVPEATTTLQQLLQPSMAQGLGTGTQLAVERFETQPASPDGDPSVVSLRSMQGSSKGLAAHGSFQDPTKLPPSPCSGRETEQDSQDAIERELQKLGCLPAANNCQATSLVPLHPGSQQQLEVSNTTAWQLVTMLQHRVGQLEQQQAALLCRIDQLQDCLQQAQHNGGAGLH